jgi:hypothetical protein
MFICCFISSVYWLMRSFVYFWTGRKLHTASALSLRNNSWHPLDRSLNTSHNRALHDGGSKIAWPCLNPYRSRLSRSLSESTEACYSRSCVDRWSLLNVCCHKARGMQSEVVSVWSYKTADVDQDSVQPWRHPDKQRTSFKAQMYC